LEGAVIIFWPVTKRNRIKVLIILYFILFSIIQLFTLIFYHKLLIYLNYEISAYEGKILIFADCRLPARDVKTCLP